ncbi:MAG: hypothetical protein KAJ10_02925 [Thermodesulfovibrionia bacterium]|nr:hypothetical protein [Thermodesulfovibrionia bacterium]
MDDFMKLLISGYFSDYVFEVIFVQTLLFIQNNLAILFLSSVMFGKISKLTKNKWDDKLAKKYHDFLTNFKKNMGGGKND